MVTEAFNSLPVVAFLPTMGTQELLIIGVIALLLFGKRLPEVARNLGKGFSEFKKGVAGFQDEVRTASSSTTRGVDYRPSSGSSASSRPKPDVSATEDDDDFKAPKFELED